MSERQIERELLEIATLSRSTSLSNHSDASNSSKSSFIKDILTSEKSKQLVDEIDTKIATLVDIIKSKKCNEDKKKYYTKKIVNRIIDKKCSNTTISSSDFGQQSLPTSTPLNSAKDLGDTKNRKTSIDDIKVVVINDSSPNNRNSNIKYDTPQLKCTVRTKKKIKSLSSETHCLTICPSEKKEIPLSERLKALSAELERYTQSPTCEFSPKHVLQTTTATHNIITEMERNVSEVKDSLTSTKIKDDVESEIQVQNEEEMVVVTERGADSRRESDKKQVSQIADDEQEQNKCETESLYDRYKHLISDIKNRAAEINKFKDLTPRTLCQVYKVEFNESTSSSKNTNSSSNKDEIDNSVKRSKDWKYFKTNSEQIFENKEQQRATKDYIIKYAKKEKQRQISWITNEIKCLSRLKHILEQNSTENLSSTDSSTLSNQFNSINMGSTDSSGTKTLKEINACLDELKKILKERKPYTISTTKAFSSNLHQRQANTSESIPTNIQQGSPEKISTSEDSSTSYKNIGSKVEILDCYPKKPTEFEIKYFREAVLSSQSSTEDCNKENINTLDTKTNHRVDVNSRNIEVQTCFSLPPSPYANKEEKNLENMMKNSEDEKLKSSLKRNCNKIISTKSSSDISESRSLAYFLQFEEAGSGSSESVRKSKSSLERITVRIPSRVHNYKRTENKASNTELQESLFRNRSDFIKAAEWRRQCINELMYIRDKRYEDMNQKILFTTKEMKDITSKRYKKTEEVQNKLRAKKSQYQKMFNRQLATVFSKKLQQKALKGEVSLSTAKPVTF